MATQVGVGFSQHTNPLEAGRRAAEQAIEPLAGRKPGLMVLFSTTDLEPRKVQAGAHDVAGEVPVIGGCSTGVIAHGSVHSSGVAALAFWSEQVHVVTDIATEVSRDPPRAGRALVQRLNVREKKAYRAANRLLLAVVDAHKGGEALVRVVEAMGDELGPLCLMAGGGVQDPSGQIERPVYLNNEMYGDAVAAALFLTSGPVGVGVKHGYKPLGHPLVVTRAEGNVLHELNGRSAFQSYVEQFPDHPELTLQSFGQFALDYPLGIPQVGREYIVRDPFAARSDGALECAGMIPEHAVVRIMVGDRETLIQSAREAAAEAIRQLAGRRPLLAVVFSCVSRLAYLGLAAQEEATVIRETVGLETPLVGLFSFGEVATQPDSPPALHNKTVVVGIIGEPQDE